jgi:hypothetical protein
MANGNDTRAESRDYAEYLIEVGKKLNKMENEHAVEEIKGETYVFHNGRADRYAERDKESPRTLDVYSLGGLVDYIIADVDGLFKDPERRHIVRVTDVDTVEVISPIYGYGSKRDVVARCVQKPPRIKFDTYMPAEDFQIIVMTQFIESENRSMVLMLAGNLRDDQSVQTADDGFSQRVTIKRGVVQVGETTVKNPAELIPIRTFNEVTQPSSPFVIRFQEGNQVALFESDGGAWKIRAVEAIRDWLRERLQGCNVEIIA